MSDSSEDDEDSAAVSRSTDEPASKKAAVLEVKKLTNEEHPGKTLKLKDSKVKKPELLTANVDISPKRPRGRPPLARELSHDLKPPSNTQSEVETNQEQPREQAQQQLLATPTFKLPAMKMDKCKVYNFPMANGKTCVAVNNNVVASKLHEINCSYDKLNWRALTSSPIVTVGASRQVIIVVCKNGSLHMFKPSERGQRLFPALQLPSPVSKLTFEQDKLALITTCGYLYVWALDQPQPRILTKENIQSLFATNSNHDHVAKLLLSPQVIIVTGHGRSFTYDSGLGGWLNLSDTSSAIQSCSSYNTALANLPPEERDLPLASLTYLAPRQNATSINVNEATKALATITHCRNQRLAAQYLRSPKEYQYWLMAEIKNLAKIGDDAGLRSCFDWLLGHDGTKEAAEDKDVYLMEGQLEKRSLLRQGLELVKSNVQLQRLYAEYNDQLRSVEEVKEIDKLLDV